MIFHAHILNELSKEEQKLVISFWKLPCISWVVERHIQLLADEFSNLDMSMLDREIITEIKRIRNLQDLWSEFNLALKEITALEENSDVVTEAEL